LRRYNSAQISLLGIQFLWTADMQGALSQAKHDKSIMNKVWQCRLNR